MKRVYETIIKQHFAHRQQMLFLAGPRQVGKTTISLAAKNLTDNFIYLNWDVDDHKKLIIQGPIKIAEFIKLSHLKENIPILVFDEIHKYSKWKIFLKGFFDLYKGKINVIVTGSSKLNIYRAGGDSLMGRYFCFCVHPISVAECVYTDQLAVRETREPKKINIEQFNNLFNFGGFPEPFLKHEHDFSNQWQRHKNQQLFREDIRDLSHIQEIQQLEMLAAIIKEQTGQLINLSNLASKISVSVNTIKRWLQTLENFYFCFLIKPWSKNITRSLIKEPKLYLWDWSGIENKGARAENFIASHLYKACQFWTDRGLGEYRLYFIRDKEKREVDFLVTKNRKPWFLVESKLSNNSSMNENLYRFQKQIKAEHAFQVNFNEPFVDVDCFSRKDPVIVPATTFLSQLV